MKTLKALPLFSNFAKKRGTKLKFNCDMNKIKLAQCIKWISENQKVTKAS